MSGNPKVAKIILKELSPFPIHQLNHQNKTGIYYLIGKKTKNIIRILKILLENGLDINFKYENENSILADFVFDFNPDLDVIEFLLQNGADSRTMTSQCQSIYDRIEDSVKNQIFYVQSQNQVKLRIFELFQKYKKVDDNEITEITENAEIIENAENIDGVQNDENNQKNENANAVSNE